MKIRHNPIWTLSWLFLTITFFSNAQKVELIEETTITNEGLYFWYPNGKESHSYAPNISPRGDCFTVANGYIFFGWYKGGMDKRNLMISRKKIGSGKWVHVQLPHTNTLVDKKFNPTPYPNGLGNSHQTISVGVSEKDNTVHILFDHHNDPLNYIISKKGKAFVSDNEFRANIFEKRRRYLASGENIRITYPELNENDKGELVVNYRVGNSHGGNETVHSYDGKWTKAKTISMGKGPGVPKNKENYAYGTTVFANGEFYYAFSVRWNNNRAFNEGVYLAKCGATFTSAWEDLNGKKHNLPIKDFSPFLVDDPATKDNMGATRGIGIAVTEKGDVHLNYIGRGNDSKYAYTYTRKAGNNKFKKHTGISKTGVAWGNRIYNVSTSGNGVIHVESTAAGSVNYKQELRLNTSKKFGNSETRIVDGNIVIIVEDRSNTKTDKQKIYCYVFKIDDGNSTNNQAPTVAITSPENNATFEVGQEISLEATANDTDGSIKNVNFKLNNDFYEFDGTAPYSATFTPTEPGTYTIGARAFDNNDAATEASITITVTEKNVAPQASFTAPSFTSIEEGYSELYINVEATDPNEDDVTVMLKIDGQEIRSESVAPYEWGHEGSPNASETLGLSVGEHTLEAVITDARGLSTTITKTITVTKTVVPPVVEILNPANGSVFYLEDEITFEANASDSDGSISKVVFTINGEFHQQDSDAPYEGIFTPTETGNYEIGAKAFDNDGETTLSTITIEVQDKLITNSKEFNRLEELTVFPNPVKGTLHLNQSAPWELHNTTGLKVDEGNGAEVDFTNKPAGIYILKIKDKIIPIVHQ